MLNGIGLILASHFQARAAEAQAQRAMSPFNKVRMQIFWLEYFRRNWVKPGTAIGVVYGKRHRIR